MMTPRSQRGLIVEDDPSWQQILSEIFADCGLAVDVAEDYLRAIPLIRAAPHRLAVLDLSLGGSDHLNRDGLRALEAVRRQDPGCAAIFLTGFATVELAVNVIQEYGALTCLRKETFRRSEFRRLVNQVLASAPLPDSPATSEKEGETQAGAGGLALVVDDDAGWRSLLSELLTEAGYKVRQSTSYIEALGMMGRLRFDLAIIDLSLASSFRSEGNQDGYRLLAHTQKADIPAIVVSANADPAQIEKAYTTRQLFACLEKQSFDRKVFLETVRQARQPSLNSVLDNLTGRERQVLALIAQGLTNKEIAQTLFITPNTVKRHLKSLFIKLGVNTRSAASARAVQSGMGEPD